MDHYHHPEFDNYLMQKNHYYHSLNAFPKGAKFQKDFGMHRVVNKMNNYNDVSLRSNLTGSMMARYKNQIKSDKGIKKSKKSTSSDVVMVYHPNGRRKRSNSQCGTYNKRPKSTKHSSGGRKYRAMKGHNNSVNESKLHSISHSIDNSTLITQERPSSVTKSIRYSKNSKAVRDRKDSKDNKDSISTSIEVPSIEIQNQDNSFHKTKGKGGNQLTYQKAANIIAQNMNRIQQNLQAKNVSNSQKVLRSTSRSGKAKHSNIKSNFKNKGNMMGKMVPGKKEGNHRKSKSDAKKMMYEMNKTSTNYKTNPKLKKSNYMDKVMQDKNFYAQMS